MWATRTMAPAGSFFSTSAAIAARFSFAAARRLPWSTSRSARIAAVYPTRDAQAHTITFRVATVALNDHSVCEGSRWPTSGRFVSLEKHLTQKPSLHFHTAPAERPNSDANQTVGTANRR